MSTERSAKCQIQNELDADIEITIFRHKFDGQSKIKEKFTVGQNCNVELFEVSYRTGIININVDYWFIKFIYKGLVFECKDSFYCYLTSKDAGGTVNIRIYKDGSTLKMVVIPPESSEATVELKKNKEAVAYCVVKNDTGMALTDLFARHKFDKEEEISNSIYLSVGSQTEPFKINYRYGLGNMTTFDYWYVKFRTDNAFFECKDNFYCYLEEEDASKTVNLILAKEDTKLYHLKVECPASKSDDAKIYRGRSEFVGGLIIVGSLFWDTDKTRDDFRKEHLQMDRAIKVEFPTEYARISEGGETTMTINNPDNNIMGTAYFVPFKNPTEEHLMIREIIQKAKDIADFEGVKFNLVKDGKYFTRSWLAIGKILNNKISIMNGGFINNLDNKWLEYSQEKDPKTSFRFSLFNTERQIKKKNSLTYKELEGKADKNTLNDIPLGNYGKIEKLQWLTAVDREQQKILDTYSYGLTCFLPPSFIDEGTTYKKASVNLTLDKRFYFFNNLASGIRTKKDYTEILTDVTLNFKTGNFIYNHDKFCFIFSDLLLKPGEYISNGDTKLIFDTKGKLLLFIRTILCGIRPMKMATRMIRMLKVENMPNFNVMMAT